MPLIYPERPTANMWQGFGQALTAGAGTVSKLGDDIYQEDRNRNILQDMVEIRAQRALEARLAEEKAAREQKEADQKSADDDHKRKIQEKLVTTISKGVPMGEFDENLVDGRPDPMLGMRPDAPQKQAYRPADENDVTGVAAAAMEPYQTAALFNKPVAAAAAHGYRMDEIGARGETALSIAEIRARATERAAHIRAKYGSRGGKAAPKDWKFTMQDATEKLADIKLDLVALEGQKPKRSWDLQPWNTEMARLVGQKKFYETQMYRANQNGEGVPTDGPDPLEVPDGQPDPDPAAAPGPTPAPPRATRPLTDKNTAAKYMAAAGGDKAKARQLAASDGWSF